MCEQSEYTRSDVCIVGTSVDLDSRCSNLGEN